MKTKLTLLVGIALGIVVSLFITGIAMKIAAPTMFFKEVKSTYDFDKTVEVLKTRINNKDGWHVTDVIDQQQEIMDAGGVDVGKVKIIKFCHAGYSGKMLSSDDRKFMSVKMPLSISVYEKSDGRVMIGLMNGYVMAKLFSTTKEGEIMEMVVTDMEDILGFLHFRFSVF